MGNHGIRESVEGQDVKTCSDLDTIVNSKYANLKGTQSGTGTQVVPDSATPTVVTIAHNLDHIPFVQGYAKESGASGFIVMPVRETLGGANLYQFSWLISADDTNIYLNLTYETLLGTPPATQTVNYKYFIYLDKGNLN